MNVPSQANNNSQKVEETKIKTAVGFRCVSRTNEVEVKAKSYEGKKPLIF